MTRYGMLLSGRDALPNCDIQADSGAGFAVKRETKDQEKATGFRYALAGGTLKPPPGLPQQKGRANNVELQIGNTTPYGSSIQR